MRVHAAHDDGVRSGEDEDIVGSASSDTAERRARHVRRLHRPNPCVSWLSCPPSDMDRLLRGTIRLAVVLGSLTPGVVRAEAEGPISAAPTARTEATTAPTEAKGEGVTPVEGGESPATMCARFHETAQIERFDGRLLEAREALRSCAEEQCPTFVRNDCVRWLDEIQGQIPTVVFEALGDEGPITDVEVRVGDRIVTRQLDGKPIEVSTGISEFTFTQPSGQQTVVRVSIRPGESNHVVSADFRRASAPTPPPPGVQQPLEAESITMVDARPIPTLAIAAGATTLIATTMGIAFGTIAKAKESDAAGSCAPDCSDGVVSEISNYALAADVAFGVAIASGITTVVLFATRPTVRIPRTSAAGGLPSHRASMAPFFAASPQAGWLGVKGRFP